MDDVGGSFWIGPAPGGGTLVRLTAPIQQPPATHADHRLHP
jgi:hypothetical protein